MDDILEDIKDIGPEELRSRLKEFGEIVGPIQETTIGVFKKKLARKILCARSSVAEKQPSQYNDSNHIDSKNIKDKVNCTTDKDNLDKVNLTPELDTTASHFFGVCVPPDCLHDDNLVFSDKTEALKAVKKYPGARFKVFKSKSEADEFSRLSSTGDSSFVSPWKTPTTPRPVSNVANHSNGVVVETCPFKAPKPGEVISLKKAIESGDLRTIETMIWENPRMLISSGDTPVILHDGTRSNALHFAAKSNQPAACQLIMDTIEDPDFIYKLWSHTMETAETRANRINFVVDLYLNTPDRVACETPLHFACKFGCKEVVAILLAHPRTDKNIKNKAGMTASQIVCTRGNCDNEELKKDILNLLEGQYYVPLLRSDDNTTQPVIGQPWSPDTCTKTSLNLASPVFSPKDPLLAVKACAGPMTPLRAEAFHKQWSTPPSNSPKHVKQKYVSARREDSDKGLERLGREIAHSMKVPWLEYWNFLQTYADLATEDGLDLLEEYLQKQRIALCIADGIEKLDMLTRSLASQGGNLLSISQMSSCNWNLMSLTEEMEKDIQVAEKVREENREIDIRAVDLLCNQNVDMTSNVKNNVSIDDQGSIISSVNNDTPPSMKSSIIKGQNLYSTPVSSWLSRSMDQSDIMGQSMESISGSASPMSCLSAIFAKLSIRDRCTANKAPPAAKSTSCSSCMGNRNIFGGVTSENPMDSSFASSYASSKPYGKIPYFKEALDRYNQQLSNEDDKENGMVGQNGVPVSFWKKPLVPVSGFENNDAKDEENHKEHEKRTQSDWRSSDKDRIPSNSDTSKESNHALDDDNYDELSISNNSELDDSLDELTNRFRSKIVLQAERSKKSMTDSQISMDDVDLSCAPRHTGIVLEMDHDKITSNMFENLFETLNEQKNVSNFKQMKSSPLKQFNRQDIVLDLKENKITSDTKSIVVDLAVIPFHCSVAEVNFFKDIPFKIVNSADILEDVELNNLPSMVDVKFNFGKDTEMQALLVDNVLKSKLFYIHGYHPSKADLDVYRALEHSSNTMLTNYPLIKQWKAAVASYTEDTSYSWQSPAKVRSRSSLSASFPLGSPQSHGSPVTYYRSPSGSRSSQKKMSSTWSMPNICTELFPASGTPNRWSMIR